MLNAGLFLCHVVSLPTLSRRAGVMLNCSVLPWRLPRARLPPSIWPRLLTMLANVIDVPAGHQSSNLMSLNDKPLSQMTKPYLCYIGLLCRLLSAPPPKSTVPLAPTSDPAMVDRRGPARISCTCFLRTRVYLLIYSLRPSDQRNSSSFVPY
jgi:hypothetical protein